MYELGDFGRMTPISRHFGYDRGLPVDRFYIEEFLARCADDIRGRVLEVGDASYTRRYGGELVTKSDVLHVEEGNRDATIVSDLMRGDDLPTGVFDCVILTQTLHLLFDIRAALRTVHRLLKPGGVVLATFPGITQISNDQWAETWHWGLTQACAARAFAEFFAPTEVVVNGAGNVLTATAFLQGLAVAELTTNELQARDPDYDLLITVRAMRSS